MGRFSKIEEVAPSQRGQVFKEGNYVVRIDACKIVDGQKGGTFFIIETTVLETDNPLIKEGEQHSQVINLTNPKAMGAPYSDVKAFIMKALGMDTDEAKKRIGEDAMEFVALEKGDNANPFGGITMGLTCVESPPKGDRKTPFTYHNWKTVDDEQAMQLKSAFEELGMLKKAA
jgi:hypothetical protein